MKKYYGKEKCRILKQVRAEIAKNNGIDWIIEECPHKGDCLGTCPKCEAEVRELEKKLEERRRLGLNVALAGVAAGIFTDYGAASAAMTRPEPAIKASPEEIRAADAKYQRYIALSRAMSAFYHE